MIIVHMSIYTKRAKSLNESNTCDTGSYDKVNVFTWHKKDSPYYEMSPYYLKTDGSECITNPGNVIFENFWQGSKVYPVVYPIEIYPHFTHRGKPHMLMWKWNTTDTLR